ncbi:MAG TPA: TonB-dependent receptor [Rhodocyclaceae bacterium]|uniref:TonB-dependent receptor plug domain-containing protein n=1 Tax=Zoogloea sp. TaxID=49181 RepID=UPI002C3B3E10|nr:TonB-dependent receptor [Zoogloea sp.]HMW50472.1 TonB-dependent receptor [Rhodocyclaceae bacterium]HNH15200.1 TonB-dependent receptor [Zoogloea sp.]
MPPLRPPHHLMAPLARTALALGIALLGTSAQADTDALSSLKQMSLDELADIRVSIASQRSERVEDTAAAVTVLTAEDIRRSGATTIPELLRTVPGLNVARISATEWAVSARGFNNQFANKLLVMVDGRSVYTPFFSGVLWDELNLVMQDIDRIEVVRGPGGSTWGANAVNGVINVITRHSEDTQGTLVGTVVGNHQSEVVARHGYRLNDHSFGRVYAKVHQADRFANPDPSTQDDMRWSGGRAGFRNDWESAGHMVTVQGEAFREMKPDERQYSGAHLLGRWEHGHGDGSRDELRAYYNQFSLDHWRAAGNAATAQINTADVNFRHHFADAGPHSLIAGFGYRAVQADANLTLPTSVTRPQRTDQLFSIFAEDTVSLAERLRLTLGVKGEHNDFTGLEWQPSARLRWTSGSGSTAWMAVSRAVRTPSIIEDSATLNSSLAPTPQTFGLPVAVSAVGNPNLASERLIAYEIGYRAQLSPRLSLDTAAFINDYDRLLSVDMIGTPSLVIPPFPPRAMSWIARAGNNLEGRATGFEISLDYRPSTTWRLLTAYSYLDLNLHTKPGNTELLPLRAEGESPRHQISIISRSDLRHDLELDVQARYVSALPAQAVADYLTADMRLAWRASKSADLALVGRNLMGPAHTEFGGLALISSSAYPVPREYYLTANLRF